MFPLIWIRLKSPQYPVPMKRLKARGIGSRKRQAKHRVHNQEKATLPDTTLCTFNRVEEIMRVSESEDNNREKSKS
jgi:hypothetical protein